MILLSKRIPAYFRVLSAATVGKSGFGFTTAFWDTAGGPQ